MNIRPGPPQSGDAPTYIWTWVDTHGYTNVPGLPLLQRLQVLFTFVLLLATSVTAAQYFAAQQLAHRLTIINAQTLGQGEEI